MGKWFRKNIRLRRKFPVVRQYEQTDCGPAVLLSVLKYYGGNDHLFHVRELCRATTEGTTLLDMIRAADLLGLKASGVRGTYQELQKENLPCIVHVHLNNHLQHYMVIYKIHDNSIMLGDPARGLIKISRVEFEKIWISRVVLLLNPGKSVYNEKPLSWLTWIKSYLKGERAWIYQAEFLGLIFTVLGVLTAFFIQQIIDEFIPGKNIVKIWYTGVFLIIVLLTKSAAGYFRERFLVILNKRLSVNINADFIVHLFNLPKKFFDSRKRGDITARIHDILKIQQAVLRIIGGTIIDVLIVFGSILSMFYFSELFGWIVCGFLPFYSILLISHSKILKTQQNEVMKNFAKVESTYIDSLDGIDDILGFNASKTFSDNNKLIFGLLQDKIEQLGFTRTRLALLSDVSGTIITVVVLIGGAINIYE